jgi:hypothetical protein
VGGSIDINMAFLEVQYRNAICREIKKAYANGRYREKYQFNTKGRIRSSGFLLDDKNKLIQVGATPASPERYAARIGQLGSVFRTLCKQESPVCSTTR